MARENNKIVQPYLILCEGRDAYEYLISLLDYLTQSSAVPDMIQVFDFHGISQLESYFEVLKNMNGYDSVKSIGIIRDAEKDCASAIHSIKRALSHNSLPVPDFPGEVKSSGVIKTGFVLFPKCDSNPLCGTLEDLCLSTLSSKKANVVMRDVNKLLKRRRYSRLKCKHKNKLHTYFSLTDKYVFMKIGEASKAGAFKFTGPHITPLRDFFLELTT